MTFFQRIDMLISIWVIKQAMRISSWILEFMRDHAIVYEPNEILEVLDEYLEFKASLAKLQEDYENGVYSYEE